MGVLPVHVQIAIHMPNRHGHWDNAVFLDHAPRTMIIAVSAAPMIVATVRARAVIVVGAVVPANAAPIGVSARSESWQCQHSQPRN
jgi:hypothetical protein